jgi:EAL domain-containing protein (putative c-di-GMP-specific phosphodiesterase class I)
LYPDDGETLQTLLAAADSALDQGKKTGRGHVNLSNTDLNQRAQRAMTIKRLLRQAMERNELEVYYQPQVDVRTCKVVSVEALLRWNSPEMGRVAPSEFIPVAEQTGLIVPIGRWVMNEACRTLAAWHREGLPEIGIAVNVSVIQLLNDDVPAMVAAALEDFQLDKKHLEIEITESAMLDMESRAVTALKQLQASGIKLAVDDFGTGYSSLSMLNTMHLDRLKIDQSFVQDVTTKPRSAAIARATISMAKNLNMICIAEGVETEAQMQFLRKENCELLQGYLFSRPLPAEEMKALLRSENKFCALAAQRAAE